MKKERGEKNMAAQPKEYFDIETAAKKDSYAISKDSLAPEVLAQKFKRFSGVEKVFYLSMVVVALMLAVTQLFIQTKTQEIESSTLHYNSQITVKEQKNSEYDQKIQELTSQDKLQKVTDKYGISYNSDNVLKATK